MRTQPLSSFDDNQKPARPLLWNTVVRRPAARCREPLHPRHFRRLLTTGLLGLGLLVSALPLVAADFISEVHRIVQTPLEPLMPGRSEADEGIVLPGLRPDRSGPLPTAGSFAIDPRWETWAQWPACPDVSATALATNFVFWSRLAIPWSYGHQRKQWREQAETAQEHLVGLRVQRAKAVEFGLDADLRKLDDQTKRERAHGGECQPETWAPAVQARKILGGLAAPWDVIGLGSALGPILAGQTGSDFGTKRLSDPQLGAVKSRLMRAANQPGVPQGVYAEALSLSHALTAIEVRCKAGDYPGARELTRAIFDEALNLTWPGEEPGWASPKELGMERTPNAPKQELPSLAPPRVTPNLGQVLNAKAALWEVAQAAALEGRGQLSAAELEAVQELIRQVEGLKRPFTESDRSATRK